MSQVKRIHCAIRARPNTEKKPIYEIDGNKIMLKNDKTVEVHQFDNVFDQSVETKAIFDEWILPKMELLERGTGVAVLLYGYSGSGKTYTVFGTPDQPGLLRLSANHIQNKFEKCSKTMMFFELYCGNQRNLLGASVDEKSEPKQFELGKALDMLDKAVQNRAKSKTGNNDKSSRSHAIVKIYIKNDGASEPVIFTIVDLAGKESQDELNLASCNEEDKKARTNECLFINKSLEGISSLMKSVHDHKGSDDPFQVNKYYRTSEALVPLLKDSLKSSVVLYLFTIALDSPSSKYAISNAKSWGQIKSDVKMMRNATCTTHLTVPSTSKSSMWGNFRSALSSIMTPSPSTASSSSSSSNFAQRLIQKVKQLQKSAEELDLEVSTLKCENATLKAGNEALEERDDEIAALKRENATLKAALVERDGQIAALKQENATLNAENQALRGDGAAAAAVDNVPAVQAVEADEAVANALDDMPEFDDIVESLKNQCEHFKNSKKALIENLIKKCENKSIKYDGLRVIDLRDMDYTHWQRIKKYKFADRKIIAENFSFQFDVLHHIGFIDAENYFGMEAKWIGTCTRGCRRTITAMVTTDDGHLYYNKLKGKLFHQCGYGQNIDQELANE